MADFTAGCARLRQRANQPAAQLSTSERAHSPPISSAPILKTFTHGCPILLWGKVAAPVTKAEWAGYALVYLTEVNRTKPPVVEHRLHLHIGASGTARVDRDLKHVYVGGLGPSGRARRVGAKALCAAFRAEEKPTACLLWFV
jgi:hypothetical protein